MMIAIYVCLFWEISVWITYDTLLIAFGSHIRGTQTMEPWMLSKPHSAQQKLKNKKKKNPKHLDLTANSVISVHKGKYPLC